MAGIKVRNAMKLMGHRTLSHWIRYRVGDDRELREEAKKLEEWRERNAGG